ncbi:MAG: LytR C-terminal domain-containing protein [Patescibacteria group bacterium]
MPTKQNPVSSLLAIGLLVVILLTAVILGIMNRVRPPQPVPKISRATTDSSDVEAVVAKVATHILVQQGEAPNVATVQDPELLKQQSPVFYKDVQVGDRLLVWSDKAVLYSPSRDILLAVVSFRPQQNTTVTDSHSSSTASTITQQEVATVEVRNGSGRAGIAKAVAEKLVKIGFRVLPPGDASTNISTTILVKSAGKEFPQTIKKLKELLRAEVAELPQEEASTTANILVIVGANEAL